MEPQRITVKNVMGSPGTTSEYASRQVRLPHRPDLPGYLHKNNFVHRDIKPENFLMQNTQDNAEIKVTKLHPSGGSHGVVMLAHLVAAVGEAVASDAAPQQTR